MNAHSFFCHLRRHRILCCAALAILALAWTSLAFCGEIHDAAAKGDLEKVKALLKDNPKLVSSRDATGETALSWAANQCHKDVVEFLLAHDAEVRTKNNDGAAPLDGAAVNGCEDVAELLLAKGADVNAKDNGGGTPLHTSAFGGHKGFAELLLAHGADVNAKDNDGLTPLHLAARKGHKDVAELLLANKADVDAREKEGWTPLLVAANAGQKGIVELLLARGADVNAKHNDGYTPLHFAAYNGYRDVAELLLASKADVNARAQNGLTPLDAAEVMEHRDLVELLRPHGAKASSGEGPSGAPKARAQSEEDLLLQLMGRPVKRPPEVVDLYDHRPPALAASTAPAGATATVYVFRARSILGAPLKPPIYCDNVELAHLQNGRYFRVQLEPGRHIFRSKPGAPGATLNAAPGGVYYIRAVMVQGGSLLLAPLRSEESPPLHKVKALDANQVIDRTRVAAKGEIPDNPTVEQ
jgi:ankyrin repeat protein